MRQRKEGQQMAVGGMGGNENADLDSERNCRRAIMEDR